MSTHRSVDLHDLIGGLSLLTLLLESTHRSDIRAHTAQDLVAIQLPKSRPASEPTNNRKHLEHTGQKTMSVGTAPSDERRRVTVENVTDEEDIYRMRSNDRSRSAGLRAPTGAKLSRSGSRTSSRKSESQRDYESDEMSDTMRAKRKDSKRRQTPISVSSDRSRDKRDRRSRAYTDDGQRSRETAQRNVRRLLELRVGEDREIAEELLLHDLQELEDRQLAEQLADQEDGLEQSKRIAAEQQQKIAAVELQLQLEHAKAEQYESQAQANKAQKLSGTSLPEEPCVPMSGTKLDFGNRVILQWYRIADIAKTGHSQIPDQGIQWGEDVNNDQGQGREWPAITCKA
ncbi:hypothetical protein C8J57DRAFT_1238484 [Mycena rebaudengoi]|nr:hypothetical protein C8J57DRAFT_1238484 [Mycena rebaudengoi]